MYLNLRLSYSEQKRGEFVALVKDGHGVNSIAHLLDLPRSTVQEWQRSYKALGEDGIFNMGATHRHYSIELKLAAVRSHVDDGMTNADVMRTYKIASQTALRRWVRQYLAGGPDALEPKLQGRPRGVGNALRPAPTELERLRVENERLRCALEVQKRLCALEERKSLEERKRRSRCL